MKRLLFISILLLQAGYSFKAGAQQVNIRSYTIENGLVNNDILNIYEDSRGFIWLCTRGGLSRYDGSRFTNFTTDNGLVNDMINDIIETGPQEFLVAQNSGGPIMLKNDRIKPISPSSNTTLNNFFLAGGRLLAATDQNGIVEWRKEGIRPLNANYKNSTIKFSRLNDSLWLVIDLGLASQLVTPSMEARSKFFAIGSTTCYVDSRHRTWIGTTKGLKLVDPLVIKDGQPSFLPLPPPFDLPILRQTFISDIFEDSQGNFWIATINGLVHIIKSGEVIIYTQQFGLPTSFVNCVREDSRHNIWIGTSMGLAKLALQKEVKVFTPDSGFGNPGMMAVLPLSKNKARLFDGKTVGLLDLNTGISSGRSLVDSAGYPLYRIGPDEFMLRRRGEATVYRARSEKTETFKWPQRDFTSIVRISQHQFIGCRIDTLYVISNGQVTQELNTGIKSPVFTTACDRSGTVWIGTFQDGLIKLEVEERQDSLHMVIVDSFAKRLPDTHIRILYTDKKNEIWIGTRYKGLVRMIELPGGKFELQHYGIGQGLSSDFVLAITRDVYGNIWAGTAQGVDKLVPEGNGYRIFNFGRVNKLFQRFGAIDFADSNHLLGTGYPTVVYARDMRQDAITAYPVYITRVSGAPADTALYNESASLPHSKAQIYFEFSSPQLINEDFSKYSYRLVGSNDASWNMAGSSRSVYFANLRPGKYSFQVRTLGFNGAWGMPATYDFLVQAPFWQKTWFIALVVFAIGLLAWSLYRYRVQQLIQLQRVRNRIATDLHDEIGSNLTNISILSNLSKTNLLQPQKAGDFLQRISEEVSSSSQALDDIIWSVNTNHDTLEETVARMRRYAAELFDSANISYELYLDPVFEGKRLSMEQRRDIYLLYKEAVNNISKHAGAQHVIIQIAIEHNQLLLSVKDDGRGFDAEKESNRYGLKSMKLRVKKWKGKISIESGPGLGTSIQVRLPVSR